MNDKTFARLIGRKSDSLDPDLIFDDHVAAQPAAPTNRSAPNTARPSALGFHPDFDFDPDFSGDPSAQGLFTTFKIGLEQPSPTLDLDAAPLNETEIYFEALLSDSGFASEIESQLDPIDLAMTLDDLVIEEGAEPEDSTLPDLDWDGQSFDAGHGFPDHGGDRRDEFDFDISDFEAAIEAEPTLQESPSAKARRLDGIAADLVLGLRAFRTAERSALHRRFRSVLEDFPHQSSHMALHRLVAAGASLEEVEETASLRKKWLHQPWLWGQKRHLLGAWEINSNPKLKYAFGWPAALRLVRIFGFVEAERAFEEDWFETWRGLQRHEASTFADEMAFFSYPEFLRQVTRPLLFSVSEGVRTDPADEEYVIELRDSQGLPIWRLERKLPPRAGEFSLETPRIRNHRSFDASAHEDAFGLGGLQAVSDIAWNEGGYMRLYQFPQQDCDLRSGIKIKVSSMLCHGMGNIDEIDQASSRIRVWVHSDAKRLLDESIAITCATVPRTMANKIQNRPSTTTAKASEEEL